MSCKNTNPTTRRKRTQNSVFSEIKSSSGVNKESASDISSTAREFQILAENCGFKVIREEDECNLNCYHEGNQSRSPSAQNSTSSSGRWSIENCCGTSAETTDSKNESTKLRSVLDFENKGQESTTPETYLVSRKYESTSEPTVDFLDMTDIENPQECYIHCVESGNGNSVEKSICFSPAAGQCTFKRHKHTKPGKCEKIKSRHKITKQDLSVVKNRNRGDKNKVNSYQKLNNRSFKLQAKMCNSFVESKEYQQQHFNVSDLNTKGIVCQGNFSSFDDGYKKDMCEQSLISKDQCKQYRSNDDVNNGVTGNAEASICSDCIHESDATTSEANQKNAQAFSNVNSSCLLPGSDQHNLATTPNSCEEGGMLSYLRKLNTQNTTGCDGILSRQSRRQLRDACCRQFCSSDRCSSNIASGSMNQQLEVAEKQNYSCNKSTFLLSSSKVKPGNKSKSPKSYHWVVTKQKASPKRLPRISRADLQTKDSERTASAESSTFSKESEETSASSLHTEENWRPDYNINFNSDDGSCDNVFSNSFIGHYLYELWKHQCLCDIRLKVGNTSFLAHKIVLAAFSDLFCPEDPQQIPITCFDVPDVSEEALSLILQYLYTSEMEITDSVLEAVYMAACVLEISEVRDLVTEILSKPTCENFDKYMVIRMRIGLCANVMDVYRDFVIDNLLDIEDSPFILSMSLPQMEKLLRDPDVKIESEEDIIRLIVKWIRYNPCQRAKYAADLLSMVNFDCVGPEMLSNIVECNRHLFDLASMDIIMAAFKDYALRCKEAKSPAVCSANSKTCKSRCSSCSPLHCKFREEEVSPCSEHCECAGSFPPDCFQDVRTCCRDQHNRCRKTGSVSPQEIRKWATRNSSGNDKNSLGCSKNSCQCDPSKRYAKPSMISVCVPSCQGKYTICKRVCDSSNNFPSECSDQRSRSVSSESRCGCISRRLNVSKNESDTGHLMSNHYCAPEVHYVRKRTLPSRIGNNNCESREGKEKCVHECGSNCLERDRAIYDCKGNSRGSNSIQMCTQSRSSSRSSGSGQRYNASSSGSSKRVTFSENE